MAQNMKAYLVWVPAWEPCVVMHATSVSKARYHGAHELGLKFEQCIKELKAHRLPEQDADEPVCPACGKDMYVCCDSEVMFCRRCYGAGPEDQWEDW